MAELKTQRTRASVAQFLAGVADEQRRADSKRLAKLLRSATGETARMWGPAIVGYGSHTLRYASGRTLDWMLVGFSPRKQALVLYISGLSKLGDLLAGLGPHKRSGGGCLYVKRLADLDEKVLVALVKRSVANLRKAARD